MMQHLQFHQLPISVPDVLGVACGMPESVRYFALFYEDAVSWVDAGWVRLECDYWNVFVPLIEHKVTRSYLFKIKAEIEESSSNTHALLIEQKGGVYVGLKQEIIEAVQQLNPIPCDPNDVMLSFLKEHYADIPPCLKALVHGQENLFIRSNTKIRDLITQHLDQKIGFSFGAPTRDFAELDCEKLLHALQTEAKTNFSNLSDGERQFSDFLLDELRNIPNGLPDTLCAQWQQIELGFRSYISQSLSKRQDIANCAYKLFHKLPFFQKLHMHKQSKGTYQLNFVGMDLRGINAEHLSLKGANFSCTDLRKAYFLGANLSDANFSGADLTGAVFTRANLSQAVFQGADLSDVIFDGATMTNADFTDAVGEYVTLKQYYSDN